MQIVDRIFPSVSLHSQANARWSYSKPPLAQTPRDLRFIFKPDPDWPWITFDHDQAELRLVAALCKDPTMLTALQQGWDLHLLAACAMFELKQPDVLKDPIHAPENDWWRKEYRWMRCDHDADLCGKDDIRRNFAKRFGHRASYGGTARKAKDIPGAKALGLTERQLVRMSHARAALFPRLATWQDEVVVLGSKTGETRTWAGRRRRYLGRGTSYTRGEMLDHPMQAGVQDIENMIFLQIADEFQEKALFKQGKHDSQDWAFHVSVFDYAKVRVREIAQPVLTINGTEMHFTASFKERLP